MQDGNAPADGPGAVTLLGLVETVEGTAANNFMERKYNFNMGNDGFPVGTAFVPLTRRQPLNFRRRPCLSELVTQA